MPRQSMKPLHACETCGRQFTQRRDASNRYCSRACYDKSRNATWQEKFRRRVGPMTASGCVLWTGPITQKGYGYLKCWRDKKHTNLTAHRAAWQLAHGPIPSSMCVCHRCDNRLCVRVDHLFLGTNADNIADRDAKGRQARGTRKVKQVKLTDDAVREIRRRYAAGGVSQQALGIEYGVAEATVYRIIHRKGWKHVT